MRCAHKRCLQTMSKGQATEGDPFGHCVSCAHWPRNYQSPSPLGLHHPEGRFSRTHAQATQGIHGNPPQNNDDGNGYRDQPQISETDP